MFAVFENDKPAKYPDYDVDPSWNNNEFDTKREAVEYASKWLGIYSPFTAGYNSNDRYQLEFHTPLSKDLNIFDSPYYYTGTEDYIIIVEKH